MPDDGPDGSAVYGRRRFLGAVSLSLSVSLAGCSGSGDAGSNGSTPRTTATGTATRTPTPGATTGEAPTPTATARTTGDGTPADGGTATDDTATGTPSPSVEDPPRTGTPVEPLRGIDDLVYEFAVERDVPAAALAVARDGDVVLERGYGWRDEARTEPTPPDARFRIASISKGLTTAAVRGLVRDGDLSMDTTVFPTLGVEPLPGDSVDDRVRDITVEHLLNHRGGLGPLRPVAPILGVETTFEMAEAMDLSDPPTTRQRVRYMLGQTPQFDPGSREAYSNFGYAVLGLFVEELTGTPYPEYVHSTLLDGEGVLYEGRTRPEDRRPSEVDYFSLRTKPNVIDLNRDQQVPIPDGGFHLEAAGGAGELVSTARTLLGFADRYLLTGAPRTGDPDGPYVLFGSLSGTLTMLLQHPAADVAVLFDRRNPLTYRNDLQSLRGDVEAELEAVEQWPA